MDSVHTTSALIYQATKAGATIFNCYSVEDVVFHNDAVAGVVVNWAPVIREGMHVDPLTIMAKAVLEGTGHDCEVARTDLHHWLPYLKQTVPDRFLLYFLPLSVHPTQRLMNVRRLHRRSGYSV